MNIARLLDPALIKLSMDTTIEPPAGDTPKSARQLREDKEKILSELVSLLEKSEKVGNRTKLLTDFINRERKASTATGHGIAFPHIRTYQAKELVIGIARSQEGYEFDAPDGEAVRLFFVMAAPSYGDDSLYLRVFKALAEVLRFDYFRERLLNAESEYEIIRAFGEME
jgi:mannitol/fructose-specific phosphotransferase system IIA component (Ntr-type)